MYDIVMIGSGPAGLSAAIYAARAQRSTLVLEKDSFGLGAIAVSERVDNYPGLFGIEGYALGEAFRKQAAAFGAQFQTGEATAVSCRDGVFHVDLRGQASIEARAVIYAAGTSYRRLGIPGAQLRGVSYCAVCDGAFYQGEEVAVIGGGDTALEDALYLSRIAKTVYLVHRRETFRANPTLQTQVRETVNITLLTQAVPVCIAGEQRAEALTVVQNGAEKTLAVSGVFVAIGSIPNTDAVRGLADLDKNGYLIAGEDGITSQPGLFAAGDVRTKQLRQVITAAADGANCAESCCRYLDGASPKG